MGRLVEAREVFNGVTGIELKVYVGWWPLPLNFTRGSSANALAVLGEFLDVLVFDTILGRL